MWSAFSSWLYSRELRRLWALSFKQVWDCYRLWVLLKLNIMHFALWYSYKPMGVREWNVVVWICLTVESGAIRRYGLLWIVVHLWRKCVTYVYRQAFRVPSAQDQPSSGDPPPGCLPKTVSWLPLDQDVKHSAF